MKSPYNQGYQLKLTDESAGILENPYKVNSDDWNLWNEGFLDAERDSIPINNWAYGVLA